MIEQWNGGAWMPDVDRAWGRLQVRRAARRRQRITSVAAAGVAVASLLAYPPARALANRCVEACLITVGANASPASAGDFAAEDQHGTAFRLSNLRGRVVVLNFWATWCRPCVTEIPWFVEFQNELGARGLSTVGVSIDEEGWKAVRPFLTRQRVNYPIVLGSDALLKHYGDIKALPVTIVIGRDGRTRAVHQGLVERARLRAELEDALR